MPIPKLSGSYFRLLTPGNPKTIKGMKQGYMTFILHLAPADLSGYEVCPKRTAGCTQSCLNVAGRGGMMAGVSHLTFDMVASGRVNTIQAARIRRTKLYFEQRALFVTQLVADIAKAIAWSEKHDVIPVFRLNGTSDIRWELMRHEGRKVIGEIFKDYTFYDYQKHSNRKNVPANYDLTFSRAENNESEVAMMLARGERVAVVFRDKATVAHYTKIGYMGARVVNGDESDLRFLEEKGVVVALYAKGPAKYDTSGFVVDV